MGSAAYFIIDTTEEFQFASGVSTNGDVYKNLIALCNSEMSLLISGAQIGQDTANGNRSKEEVSVDQLVKLVNGDKRNVKNWMNSIVLPALVRLGVMPDGLLFSFNSEEDTGELWNRTAQAMDRMNYILDKNLKAGRIVQFGEIGNFRLTLGSKGSKASDKFDTSLIKKPRIVFFPGKALQETRTLTEFERDGVKKETTGGNSGAGTGGEEKPGGL